MKYTQKEIIAYLKTYKSNFWNKISVNMAVHMVKILKLKNLHPNPFLPLNIESIFIHYHNMSICINCYQIYCQIIKLSDISLELHKLITSTNIIPLNQEMTRIIHSNKLPEAVSDYFILV